MPSVTLTVKLSEGFVPEGIAFTKLASATYKYLPVVLSTYKVP